MISLGARGLGEESKGGDNNDGEQAGIRAANGLAKQTRLQGTPSGTENRAMCVKRN